MTRMQPWRIQFTVSPPLDDYPTYSDSHARAHWYEEQAEKLVALCRLSPEDKAHPDDPRRLLMVELPRSRHVVRFEQCGPDFRLTTCVLADETAESRLQRLRAFFVERGWKMPIAHGA